MNTKGGLPNVHSAIVKAAGIGELGLTLAQTFSQHPWQNGLGAFDAYQQVVQRSTATWQLPTSMLAPSTAILENSGLWTALRDVAEATNITSRLQGEFAPENFYKAFIPSAEAMAGMNKMLESIDITRPFREAVEAGIPNGVYENFLSSTAIPTLSEASTWRLQSTFIDSIGNEHWRELFSSVLDHYSPEQLEEVTAEPKAPAHFGLFHERVHEQILSAACWLEEDYPQYKAKALDGANTIIAACLWTWWIQLGALLVMIGDAQGLVMAAVIMGSVKIYDTHRRERLGPEARRALDRQCPYCQALVNMWCITLKGSLPGSNAHGLHAERIQLSYG